METKLIQIGNSKGVRIPQKILGQCRMEDRIDLTVSDRSIILTPLTKNHREGWAAAAQKMSKEGDDALLIPDVLADDQELQW
jgi:antitoxin MazE